MRALQRIASRDETRYVLNGVYAEPLENGRCVFVASDGRRLVAWYTDAAQAHGSSFIIPGALIDAASIPAWLSSNVTVVVEDAPRGEDGRRVTLRAANGTIAISASAIEGIYPASWREILSKKPDKTSLGLLGLNVEFFRDIWETASVLGGKRWKGLRITGEDEHSPLFLQAENFEAALMPVRYFDGTYVGLPKQALETAVA